MPSLLDKHSENAAGKWYVTTFCIDCDICREIAPANFKRGRYGGQGDVFVYKQPVNQVALVSANGPRPNVPWMPSVMMAGDLFVKFHRTSLN